MRDELPDWLDADPDEPTSPPGGRRRSVLRLAAIVPWAVVAVLLALGRSGAVDAGGDVGETASPDAATMSARDVQDTEVLGDRSDRDGADTGPPSAPTTADAPSATELRGAWRLGPDEGDAAALAVAVARAWLTGIDPRSSIHGIAPVSDHTYVEHLALEAVERTGPRSAVVSLLAVILERDGDHAEVRTGRLSVPIVFVDDGVRPAGTPWWAATPDLRPVVPITEPVDDADVRLAAVDALQHAGFADVDLQALGRTDMGPWIASVRGRAPDGSPLDGDVWLRPHLDGFVVAGATLHRPTAPDTSEDPA